MSGDMQGESITAPVLACQFFFSDDGSEHLIVAQGNYLKIFKVGDLKCFCRVIQLPVADKIIRFKKSVDNQFIIAITEFHFFVASTKDMDFGLVDIKIRERILDVTMEVEQNQRIFWVILSKGQVFKLLHGEIVTRMYLEHHILFYSASLKLTSDSLIVAYGSIFSGIFIAKIPKVSQKNSPGFIKILKNLSGHTGSIFDLQFHDNEDTLASCSDDRTICIWKFTDRLSFSKYQVSTCEGHGARVWKIAFGSDFIASISEDNTCRLWDFAGNCFGLLEGKRGNKSIWSVTVNSSCQKICYGSNDGSCQIANVPTSNHEIIMESSSKYEIKLPQNQAIKNFTFQTSLSNSIFLTTQTGSVFHFDGVSWVEIFYSSDLARYSVLSCSKDGMIFIGDLKGNLYFGEINSDASKTKISKSLHCFGSKIIQILMFGGFVFVEVVGQGIFMFKYLSEVIVQLPHTSSESILCGCVDETKRNFYFGCRSGTILHYSSRLDSDLERGFQFIDVIFKNERKDAVTRVEIFGSELVFIDRSGYLRHVDLKTKSITSSHRITKGWLECFFSTKSNNQDPLSDGQNHFLIGGFYREHFFLIDAKTKCMLKKIFCAGGHRLWLSDWNSMDRVFRFGYIRLDKLYVHSDCEMFSGDGGLWNESLVLESWHGKEIRCSLSIPDRFIASGSEDGRLIISKDFKIIDNNDNHTSGIKSLAFIVFAGRNLLISGGSNEEAFIWELDCNGKMSLLTKLPYISKTREARVMGVSLVICDNVLVLILGYSDGNIRIWEAKDDFKIITLIQTIPNPHGHNCIKQLVSLDNLGFFSTGTDGSVNFWMCQKLIDNLGYSSSSTENANDNFEKPKINFTLLHKDETRHQSGVNVLVVTKIDSGIWMVCSGGDDCQITISKYSIVKGFYNHVKSLGQHSSAVTALEFLSPTLIVSSSIDQQIILFQIDENSRDLNVLRRGRTVISDVGSIAAVSSDEFVVFGVGQEKVKVDTGK